MGLQPTTTERSIVDQNLWQKSDFGQHNAQTGTLDLTKFETDPNGGFIPDGFLVVKNLVSGLYEPAIAWSTTPDPDGYVQAAKADGHVYKPVAYDAGQTRAPFALFWTGRVDASEVPLPTAHAGATFDVTKGARGIVYV